MASQSSWLCQNRRFLTCQKNLPDHETCRNMPPPPETTILIFLLILVKDHFQHHSAGGMVWPQVKHMLGAHIQREVGFSKNLKWATSPPATKLEFYREPSAITFWKSTHVSSKPLLRKEDVLFNFLLLLSFQVPISMELFNIKPFLKNARHSAFVTKISNHWRSIRFHPGTKDLCHTTSGLRKNDIQLLQHAVNSSVVPGLPVLYQMH